MLIAAIASFFSEIKKLCCQEKYFMVHPKVGFIFVYLKQNMGKMLLKCKFYIEFFSNYASSYYLIWLNQIYDFGPKTYFSFIKNKNINVVSHLGNRDNKYFWELMFIQEFNLVCHHGKKEKMWLYDCFTRSFLFIFCIFLKGLDFVVSYFNFLNWTTYKRLTLQTLYIYICLSILKCCFIVKRSNILRITIDAVGFKIS